MDNMDNKDLPMLNLIQSSAQLKKNQMVSTKSRSRSWYTKVQRNKLESAFRKTPYPCPTSRAEICRDVELSEDQVSVWFKNQRSKIKRNKKHLSSSPETIDLCSSPEEVSSTTEDHSERKSNEVQSNNNSYASLASQLDMRSYNYSYPHPAPQYDMRPWSDNYSIQLPACQYNMPSYNHSDPPSASQYDMRSYNYSYPHPAPQYDMRPWSDNYSIQLPACQYNMPSYNHSDPRSASQYDMRSYNYSYPPPAPQYDMRSFNLYQKSYKNYNSNFSSCQNVLPGDTFIRDEYFICKYCSKKHVRPNFECPAKMESTNLNTTVNTFVNNLDNLKNGDDDLPDDLKGVTPFISS